MEEQADEARPAGKDGETQPPGSRALRSDPHIFLDELKSRSAVQMAYNSRRLDDENVAVRRSADRNWPAVPRGEYRVGRHHCVRLQRGWPPRHGDDRP